MRLREDDVILRRYLYALALVAVAFALRWAISPLVGTGAVFLFFVLAVLVAAVRLGTGPAVLASVIGGVAGTFAFVPPEYAFVPLNSDKLTSLLAFLVVCAAITAFAWNLLVRRVELESREATLERDIREQRLIDAAQDYAIYELDRNGRILTWNKGAERLKGWKASEIVGKPYNILHTPESRATNAPGRELKIAAKTGRFEEEAPRMRKDGTIFAAHVSLFPLRDGSGEVTGFVKVTRDISDRSKGGKAILESRRRMEAIVQSAMDAIISFDAELRIVLFNPAAERIFGYSSDQVLGKRIGMLFPAEIRAEESESFRAFVSGRDANRRLDGHRSLVALRKSGQEFPVEASMSQVTVSGERVGTIILRDVTERKTNEEARALLAREVDHRAKNALAVAQALVGLTRADTVEDFAEAIRGRIASLARAHSLLSQSQWRGVPLDQLVRDELLPYASDSQLTVEGAAVACTAGAVQSLSLLFHELATNAVKYGALGRESGHVTVEWKLGPGAMLVTWSESGGPKVKTPKRQGFGTKLLRQVTGRQLDADLDFDWDPGGLRVKISLPAKLFMAAEAAESTDGHDEEAPSAKTVARERRILIVEDEELVALELTTELSRLGWAVVGPAATVGEAQSLLSTQFDAAVLDVNLRGRSAYTLAETLAERHVPFLFCTGYEIADPEGRFPDVPVIRKPVHPEAVSAALSELLASRAN